MNNFQFHVTTNILFGKGQMEKLPEVLAPFGKKVLLTYGGGSIKKTGLYDKILNLLKGFEVYPFGGIDPNPRVESVKEGARLCREHGIDVILAVGGGSTIDCSKAIAAAAYYEGDAWDMVKLSPKGANGPITKALPVCTVLTLSATGSEMNTVGVISNMQTNEKLGFASPLVLPKCSILDPENTFTVPVSQTAAGSADIFSHVLEVYFNPVNAFLTDRLSESVLKTVLHYAPVAMETPDDYEARANLMWAGSLAINGLCAAGKKPLPWTCHSMEHELSAHYDVTHGVGLAILTPRWMRHVLSDSTVQKFAEYGVRVWDADASLPPYEIANRAIDATEAFFASLGLPMTLSALGIGEEKLEAMAAHAAEFGGLARGYVPLDKDAALAIFRACL